MKKRETEMRKEERGAKKKEAIEAKRSEITTRALCVTDLTGML